MTTGTTFALILTAGVRENYGAHTWDGKGECPQYWKRKGSIEVMVRENLTVTDVMELGPASFRNLAVHAMPESDEYYEYYGMDYELVELTSELVVRVREYMASDDCYLANDAYGYIGVAMDLNITEYAAKWAMSQLNLEVAV